MWLGWYEGSLVRLSQWNKDAGHQNMRHRSAKWRHVSSRHVVGLQTLEHLDTDSELQQKAMINGIERSCYMEIQERQSV